MFSEEFNSFIEGSNQKALPSPIWLSLRTTYYPKFLEIVQSQELKGLRPLGRQEATTVRRSFFLCSHLIPRILFA